MDKNGEIKNLRMEKEYAELNRKLWNERTAIHYASSFYDVDSFIQGAEILNSIELDLLGDVNQKSLLHLQCHFGMDTIALARKGAEVTGIDLSDEAIKKANELKSQTQISADFICCNVYDTLQFIRHQFDIVFTSYGVIGWLPDLNKWAEIIYSTLKPNGVFVLAEFHPMVWMFDNDFKKIQYSYFNKQVIFENEEGTYADLTASIEQNTSVSWNHDLSEVINALIHAGFVLEVFNEYDYSPYNCFKHTIEPEKGKFRIQGLEEKIPMVYALRVRKIH